MLGRHHGHPFSTSTPATHSHPLWVRWIGAASLILLMGLVAGTASADEPTPAPANFECHRDRDRDH